jgi:hypothetical protein
VVVTVNGISSLILCYLFFVYLMALSITQIIQLWEMQFLVNNEFGSTVMALVVVLPHYAPGGTEESTAGKFLGSRFVPGTSRKWCVALSTATFSHSSSYTLHAHYLLYTYAQSAFRYKYKIRIFAAGLRQHSYSLFRTPSRSMTLLPRMRG